MGENCQFSRNPVNKSTNLLNALLMICVVVKNWTVVVGKDLSLLSESATKIYPQVQHVNI